MRTELFNRLVVLVFHVVLVGSTVRGRSIRGETADTASKGTSSSRDGTETVISMSKSTGNRTLKGGPTGGGNRRVFINRTEGN